MNEYFVVVEGFVNCLMICQMICPMGPLLVIMLGLLVGTMLYILIAFPPLRRDIIKESTKKEKIIEIIKIFEKSLEVYKSELEKDPDSFFFAGIVKGTEEYIIELKTKLNQ